jgi:hypothetical protein
MTSPPCLQLLVRRYVRAPRLQNSHLRTFNVADGNPLSIRECYEWLAQAWSVRCRQRARRAAA